MEEAQGQKVTHDCIVHKANVPLAKGESLGMYTNLLSNDGRQYIMKQLNLNSLSKPSYASAYMIEAYENKAVFDVYKYNGPDAPGAYKYYAVNYARKSDGKFEFKDLTEVQRVVSFQAKPQMEVTKGKKAEEMEDEAELSSKKPKKTTKEFMPGWESTAKAGDVWAGIL